MDATKENRVAVDAIATNPAPATPVVPAVAEADESSPFSASGQTRKRKRFQIDLVPGETTVVSWKKMLMEGKCEIDEPSAPIEVTEELMQETETQDEKDELLQKEMSGTKHSGKLFTGSGGTLNTCKIILIKLRLLKRKMSPPPCEAKGCPYSCTTTTVQPPSVDERFSDQSDEDLNVKSNHNRDVEPHYSFHASVGFSVEKPCDPSIRFECSSVAITVNQCSSALPLEDSETGICTYSACTENNMEVPSNKRKAVEEKIHSTRPAQT